MVAKEALPAEISSIEAIQRLAMQGFETWLRYGDVNVMQRGDLLLFDYTTAAHVANRWNFFERVSRGLIINRITGEIVARPFDKFFYWLEGRTTRGHLVSITEKVDGSLGVLFRHKGQYHVTTKGSFFSPQTRWATKFLREHFDLRGLPDELTLLFEIIYPDNHIVVDYGNRADLILLAARNRFTGDYLPFFPDLYTLAEQAGFSLPQVYQFNSVDDMIALTGRKDANFEGWVAEFSDGQRFKFKMDWYIEIHALLRSLDMRGLIKAEQRGDTDYILQRVPAALREQTLQRINTIRGTVAEILENTEAAFNIAPMESREEFVRWVQAQRPELEPYLLAKWDGQRITPLIYRLAFRERIASEQAEARQHVPDVEK